MPENCKHMKMKVDALTKDLSHRAKFCFWCQKRGFVFIFLNFLYNAFCEHYNLSQFYCFLFQQTVKLTKQTYSVENVFHLFDDRLVCYLCRALEKYILAKVIVSMNICLQYCNVHYILSISSTIAMQDFSFMCILIHGREHGKIFDRKC